MVNASVAMLRCASTITTSKNTLKRFILQNMDTLKKINGHRKYFDTSIHESPMRF